MSLTTIFRSIVGRLFDNTNSNFLTKPSEIEKYLNTFPEPRDDFERALFHYKATMYQFGKTGPAYFILNLAGAIAYYPYLIKFLLDGLKVKQEKESDVFFSDRISKNTIPNSILKRYPKLVELKMAEKMSLSKKDMQFLKEVKRRSRFQYYFQLKVLLKVAMFSDAIRRYHPRAIITYSESSFSTSAATRYCEDNNVKLIGIMHGERDYALKLAFFRCSEYYAWDEEYVKILIRLRCEESQFRVEVPDALALPDYRGNENAMFDYTFYLQDETSDTLEKLSYVYNLMTNCGYKVCIRPHPDFIEELKGKLGNDVLIENPREVSLTTSFERTKCVIAKFSTVLFQAWYVGIPVMIDDFTIEGLYDILKSKDYVILKKPHERLTTLIIGLENTDEPT